MLVHVMIRSKVTVYTRPTRLKDIFNEALYYLIFMYVYNNISTKQHLET